MKLEGRGGGEASLASPLLDLPMKGLQSEHHRHYAVHAPSLLPSVNEVWGKVMLSKVFVCPQRGEGLGTSHASPQPPSPFNRPGQLSPPY